MPLPEGYLPRLGDILTFRAQVRHNVWVKFSTAGGYATYSANDLTEAETDVSAKDFGLPEAIPPRAPVDTDDKPTF